MAPNQGRLAVAATMATLLTALAMRPLVDGVGWFAATAVVVVATATAGAAARQILRWWVPVVVIQAGVLVVTVTALFARADAVWGLLPGPTAVAALNDLVAQGLEVTRSQAAPVDATSGVLLMITGGIGVVGLAVDVVAVSLRRPAAAGLPLLAVYSVPAALLSPGLPWIWFVLAATGYLVLVAADSADRIRGWGRILADPRHPDSATSAGISGLAAPGGRRTGAAVLAIATVVPALVPGLGDRFLGRGSGFGEGNGSGPQISVVNPILNLRQDLTARNDRTVITYVTTAAQPQPLRIVTADVFDGSTWRPDTDVKIPRNQNVQRGLPQAPGLTDSAVTRTRVQTEIRVGDLDQAYLPLPYPAVSVDVAGTWLYDTATLNVVGEDTRTRGLTYTVQHLDVRPTADQLSAAGPAPTSVLGPYTTLPQGLPAQIGEIARQVAGTGDAYQQAVRIQRWFRSDGGFQYSENSPVDGPEDGGQNAVLTFLTTNRAGYCVQFAASMAVMARTLGIPARVAVGFLPGEKDPTAANTWRISLRDAHAWPELYFQGAGWIRFEPTPPTRTAAAPDWTVPPPGILPEDGTTTDQPSQAPTTAAPTVTDPAGRPGAQAVDERTLSQRTLDAVPWRLLAALAVLALLTALPMVATSLTRRRRRRRGRGAVERVEVAWDELRDRLTDLGVPWAWSWTPRALEGRLVADRHLDEPVAAALHRLVEDLESVRYARPASPGGRPEPALHRDVMAVVAAVAATVPSSARRRARWLPASGMTAVTGALRWVEVPAAGESGDGGGAPAAGSDRVRQPVGPRS